MFSFLFWKDRVLLIGPSFSTAEHQHHAHQVTLGLGAPVIVRHGAQSVSAQCVLIPADHRHTLLTQGETVSLLVAPEAVPIPKQGGISELALGELVEGVGASSGSAEWQGWAARMSEAAFGMEEPRAQSSRRVTRLLEQLNETRCEGASSAEVAREFGISVSRFTHLFSREVGVPFRTYMLWLRLRTALELVCGGASLTHAAHSAGFSDSVHLSRTFRSMFGMAPSELLAGAHFERVEV